MPLRPRRLFPLFVRVVAASLTLIRKGLDCILSIHELLYFVHKLLHSVGSSSGKGFYEEAVQPNSSKEGHQDYTLITVVYGQFLSIEAKH
jgi:hypothetical protein